MFLFIHLSSLDDGQTAWNRTSKDCPLRGKYVHPDNFSVKGWAVIHQSGVLTPPHHDSEGQNTFVIGVTGLKLWSVFNARDRQNLRSQLEATINLCGDRILDDFEGETVDVCPGDLL
jgi:hypothetical protein